MVVKTRWIKLRRRISDYVGNVDQGIRIRVDAVDALNMPTKIFRYLLQDVNPQSGAKAGMFDGVASPVDIAEMPEDTPVVTADPAWFRLDYVDLILPSRETALEFWDDLWSDIQGLKATYDTMDTFEEDEDFIAGTVSSSSSSSSSAGV